MIDLGTPHIPLGLPIQEGIAVLEGIGTPMGEKSGHEFCFRVRTPRFSVAIYPRDGIIRSVWYDDPIGREFERGRWEKVEGYLSRYGSLLHWERRLDNGWMHYWFNPIDRAQMVYGIHKDVIRFNQYNEENA